MCASGASLRPPPRFAGFAEWREGWFRIYCDRHSMTTPNDAQPAHTGRKPFWKLRSLHLALVMALAGLLMWDQTPAPSNPPTGTPRGGSGLAQSYPANTESAQAAKPKSPALFRFGASYIAGFLFGWIFRKSIKFGLVLAGVATAAILVARQTGWIELDWAALQAHVSQSLAWLHGELGALKHFFLGYSPSTAAGCVGIFMGARHG